MKHFSSAVSTPGIHTSPLPHLDKPEKCPQLMVKTELEALIRFVTTGLLTSHNVCGKKNLLRLEIRWEYS